MLVASDFPYRLDGRERKQESAAASHLFFGLTPVQHQGWMLMVKQAKKPRIFGMRDTGFSRGSQKDGKHIGWLMQGDNRDLQQ